MIETQCLKMSYAHIAINLFVDSQHSLFSIHGSIVHTKQTIRSLALSQRNPVNKAPARRDDPVILLRATQD